MLVKAYYLIEEIYFAVGFLGSSKQLKQNKSPTFFFDKCEKKGTKENFVSRSFLFGKKTLSLLRIFIFVKKYFFVS
jgi:hypothetical protein